MQGFIILITKFDMHSSNHKVIDHHPPKRDNHQFKFYTYEIYFHLVLVLVHMLLMLHLLSSQAIENGAIRTSPSYLSPLIGRERDSHDLQWQTFRKNMHILIISMCLWYVIAKLIQKYRNQKAWIFGVIFLLTAFRLDFIPYMLFVLGWYYFTIKCQQLKYFVTLCWSIVIFTLYLNEFTNHFQGLSQYISDFIPFQSFKIDKRQISWGQTLNMTFLRLLSFSLDLKRGKQDRQAQKHISKCKMCSSLDYCIKGRNFIEPDNYGLLNYLNYILFVPTLLTGPPISYKNFISFKQKPSKKEPNFMRCSLLFISFQIFQHFLPVINLNENQSLMLAQIITLFHLVFIWYKFLVIWRIHRAFAQLFGIEVIDNMSRCIFNNYSFQGFWRMWHRGFNQWLIRYLYIPLGGNKKIHAVIATVMFVAFWHDHTLNIVFWALAIMLFILPEIIIKQIIRKNYAYLYQKQWFKYLCALVAASYIYLLVLANIIGFGYGVKHLPFLWQKLQQQWWQLVWGLLAVSSCVILMFYKRSIEKEDLNY